MAVVTSIVHPLLSSFLHFSPSFRESAHGGPCVQAHQTVAAVCGECILYVRRPEADTEKWIRFSITLAKAAVSIVAFRSDTQMNMH